MVYCIIPFQALVHHWPLALIIALILYLWLCHSLRYRRRNTISASVSSSVQQISLPTAFAIHNTLVTLEFPSTFPAATMFALFKTYGIPSISSLLVQTNQLAGPPLTSSKRYADTGALLLEAVLNEPGSKRAMEAIARINYLHDRWRDKGRGKGKGMISDEDMLYTISLFALEPMRWVKKYEWRELSNIEVCAVGTLWKYLGHMLKVPFHPLPGYEEGWKNGGALAWMEELDAWSRAYQEKEMVPTESNHTLADSTFNILLHKFPKSLHAFGSKIFATVMEPKLREAMMYIKLLKTLLTLAANELTHSSIPHPPPLYPITLAFLISLRKVILRYASLPRYTPKTRMPIRSPTHPNRMNLDRGRMHPWYILPTFRNRWGPGALFTRLKGDGGLIPGNERKYMPEGFLTKELGPIGLMDRGKEEMEEEMKRLEVEGGGGCPFVRM
ncbi:MAG: hypothetical protein Q9209_007077 [Squamulea sp. 1 TL-2023]